MKTGRQRVPADLFNRLVSEGLLLKKRGNFVSLTNVSGCENPLIQHAVTFRVVMAANAQLKKARASEHFATHSLAGASGLYSQWFSRTGRCPANATALVATTGDVESRHAVRPPRVFGCRAVAL